KREMKRTIDSFKEQGMSEQEATQKVNAKQADLIAALINELLLIQKGKDLNFTDDVEAEGNKRLLEIAKSENIKTIEELDKAMRAQQIDPADFRESLRTDIMKNLVFNREVDGKIFYSITPAEAKKYYDEHRDRFSSVDLSEIFLNLAGKPEAEIKAKAEQIVKRLRTGEDFGTVAVATSERMGEDGSPLAPKTKGKLGRVMVSNITKPNIAAAIRTLSKGSVTDPIRTDEGFLILHIDDRDDAFVDNQVREAITYEKAVKAREEYLQTLRSDAYVKVADNYKASVAPLLKLKETPEVATPKSDKIAEKKDGKDKKEKKP
ncbi:MAG: peptidylprolyl isomerase, partial [Pyrinomonadaceae bacterium]